MSLFHRLRQNLASLLRCEAPIRLHLNDQHRDFLNQSVAFYRQLTNDNKIEFAQRCLSFIQVTEFVGHHCEVSIEDKLLVASGSVILAWGFKDWHYVKVDSVILVPVSFNENSEFGQQDSTISGLVGSHHLAGKMILSKAALHAGFSNHQDKRNVAIHEFAHLIDMADGDCDGLPKQITDAAFCLPWLGMVRKGIVDINQKKSNIRPYGATNQAEFFAVISEYFFERPTLFAQKHPKLHQALESFYQQNLSHLKTIVQIRKKDPCPCGSGKRYKRCCLHA